MKVSADRILYLSRVILRKIKENMNLVQKTDDETARLAIVRVLTESHRELEQIEQKVHDSLSRRKSINPRDQDYMFSKSLEEELRKRGA